MVTKLTEAQCVAAMADKEFGEDVIAAAPAVAVVLTQSWCPQWKWMNLYLKAVADSPDRAVFWVEYDREGFYEDFMAFKENTWRNFEIPYVRYYRDGILKRESNFIDKSGFVRMLQSGT